MAFEFIKLDQYKAQLGNPAEFFVDGSGPGLRVVRHATGVPEWEIGGDGKLVPFVPPKSDPNASPITTEVTVNAADAAFKNA